MMNSKRIEEIQKACAYPESISVMQALLQVWNECSRETTSTNPILKEVAHLTRCTCLQGACIGFLRLRTHPRLLFHSQRQPLAVPYRRRPNQKQRNR